MRCGVRYLGTMACEDETVFLEFEEKRIREFFAKQGETVEAETFADGTPLLEQVSRGKRYDLILLNFHSPENGNKIENQ